jgi:GT2 family glycosyltransferase
MNAYGPRRMVDIDIAQPISGLQADPGFAGAFAVVWRDGSPLCTLDIQDGELPLSPAAVLQRILQRAVPALGWRLFGEDFAGHPPLPPGKPHNRSSPDLSAILDAADLLGLLDRSLEQEARVDGPTVSLIICTRDRPKQLATCLRAVSALRPPPEEVIVVNNSPSDKATEAVVREFPDIRYLLEPKPGLSAARNAGIAVASGELIAFTDDDVQVTENWISRIQQALADPDHMAMSGLMLPSELETEAQVAFQSRRKRGIPLPYRPLTFDSAFFEGWRSRGVPCWLIGAGANMAFRRQVFDSVGLFDERLGAGAAGCSEDSEMWYRILSRGHSCRYDPACVVRHSHRRTVEEARSQAFLYMRGHVTALVVQAVEHGHLGNLNRLFVKLPWYYLREFLGVLWHGFDINARLTLWEMMGVPAGLCYAAAQLWRPKHRAIDRLRADLAPTAQ